MYKTEEKINEIFGDNEPTGFGTGWWSGVLSAFFGILAFGAVVCLHFPQLLSAPELRAYYPMDLIRLLIQAVIVAAIVCGVVSAMLRRKKILALTGMLAALGATLLGGSSVPIMSGNVATRLPAAWIAVEASSTSPSLRRFCWGRNSMA